MVLVIITAGWVGSGIGHAVKFHREGLVMFLYNGKADLGSEITSA
jgi:hypothetical protein